MTITDFENKISEAKTAYRNIMEETLILLKSDDCNKELVQTQLNKLHSSAVAYFSIFSRSITEYSTSSYDSNDNVIMSKVDDAIIISNTIIKYWKHLIYYQAKYGVRIPEPPENGYSTIQALVNRYNRKKAKELKKKFKEANLAVDGFRRSRKHKIITDDYVIFGYKIPWFIIALLSAVIGVILYKIVEYNPKWFDEVLIFVAILILVMMYNPKRRYFRAFSGIITLLSSLAFIPGIDFKAEIESSSFNAIERQVYSLVIKDPHWTLYLGLFVLALFCLYLDSKENSKKRS